MNFNEGDKVAIHSGLFPRDATGTIFTTRVSSVTGRIVYGVVLDDSVTNHRYTIGLLHSLGGLLPSAKGRWFEEAELRRLTYRYEEEEEVDEL